ncbi:MAG TPA: glycosyltransferase [Vicinamibacterales bacterium]|nr:glycosyltransferase [Vicinamibacterales bacterium]
MTRAHHQRRHVDATVLICTYNRAALLAETLDAVARMRTALSWDVLVVDNNSTDETRAVVESRQAAYPVRLRYAFEPRQGNSFALNTGIAATPATVIAFTDDDVRVTEAWLQEACAPILSNTGIDYTGGPVRPIWDAPPPPWIDQTRSDLWGTLAMLDYGRTPFVFEERQRVPLGANMAVRRALFERVGHFDTNLGRIRNSLRGQAQAEFFCRSRTAGARGLYVPAMAVDHHIPAARLTRRYFRRWWFMKGMGRHCLEQIHPKTELGIDLARVPKIGGMPRYMYGSAVRDLAGYLRAVAARDAVAAVRHEMMLWYFAGYARGCVSAAAPARPARSAPAAN